MRKDVGRTLEGPRMHDTEGKSTSLTTLEVIRGFRPGSQSAEIQERDERQRC